MSADFIPDRAVAGLVLGVDVGSTTVKTALLNAATREVLWTRYERHQSHQAETLARQLLAFESEFPPERARALRVFLTGSGGAALAQALGGKFVQEVNAVTIAVDALHPDAGSVIELGGQDAKIIIYKSAATPGARRAIASMNDKCASGTGATIDKCIAKVGMPIEAAATLAWDPSKLHHVAAKCGVFAETDIVNLVKSGIPASEVLCSLADAIVQQNLAVLTRGNTVRHRVLLLGGPNTFLKFLQGAWRQRIVELWRERGYSVPEGAAVEEMVFVPPRSEFYAAYGAALFGLQEPESVGVYRGAEALSRIGDAAARRTVACGPPLVTDAAERDAFVARYRIPAFAPAPIRSGDRVRGFIGVDGGSTSSKAVLVSDDGAVLDKRYQLSRGNPLADVKELLAGLKESVAGRGGELEVLGVGVTGYAAEVLGTTLAADASIVETVAHMQAALNYFPDADVICDVGGQDIKVLFMEHGRIRNFRLSNQCSAGNGALLQAMAAQCGIPIEAYADVAFSAARSTVFNYGCAVFLDTDRVTFQRDGAQTDELLAGLALVLPKNIWQYVVQLPRLAQLGRTFVLQGGTQYNLAAVKAQHDYLTERVPGAVIRVHPHCGEAGALGAALEARRVVSMRGASRFIGLDAAIALAYTTRSDESTVCHFCPNHCRRTFIDSVTPTGDVSRYIAGFSCENGTVESKEALKRVASRRKSLRAEFPNLVQYESELAFRSFFRPADLPAGDLRTADGSGRLRMPWRRPALGFARSGSEAQARRRQIRIAMPRVLNFYSTAPFFRAYFATLGIPDRSVHFSDFTSEEQWQAGGRYGSIDPCFPAKVVQAHVHELLYSHPAAGKPDYLFFPCITRLPSFVTGMPDAAACPVVAGTPKVIRAAFTKELDHFAARGIDYVDPALTLTEPTLLRRQMFEAWGGRLDITEAENDFAVEQGFEAWRAFDAELQQRGASVLEQLERDRRVGILLLARPYHGDPGLNHAVLEEFQALGYPILSIRSIPKDPAWLRRFFPELPADRSPLSIADVWPEAYSTNSAEKVWAAKFAARHPNIVVLDLSSFKCGNDAPTYGLIDSVIGAGKTPYAALHDLDANRPAGSMQIRVRTYEYTLRRHTESLQLLAERRTELERLVDEQRRALYAERQRALDALAGGASTLERERQGSLADAYRDYLDAERPVPSGRAPEPRRHPAPGDHPQEIVVEFRPRVRARTEALQRSGT